MYNIENGEVESKDISFIDETDYKNSMLEYLVQEANKMINEGYELNAVAKDIKELNIEKEYISALKEGIKREYYGKGIIFALKMLKLL